MAEAKKSIKLSKRAIMRRRRERRAIIIMVLIAVLCVAGGSYAVLKSYVDKTQTDVICDNIYIGNVDVSGMKKKEAKAAIDQDLQNDSSLSVRMNVKEGTVEVFLKEMGFGCEDEDALIQKALDYGKKGNMWKRYRQMKALEKEPYKIKETYEVDSKDLKKLMMERGAEFLKQAENAYIIRNHETKERQVVKEKDGETVDVKESAKIINERLNNSWDHKAFAVDLVVKADKPEITEEILKEVPDELGAFYTDAGGGERWNNLKNGAAKINGTLLQPGEEFSMYQTVGPFTEENGYAEGTAYENGQVVPSIGGGICQVSTTLYNAVIYSELQVLERHPHTMAVDYVDPSRDAAIFGDQLDFRFKNQYKTPVYILSEIDANNLLRVVIYGQDKRSKSRRVEFESETLSTEEYGTTYETSSELSFGNIDYAGSPHTGKSARLWKIVYENEKETSREVFNESVYEKSDQIIRVGIAGGSASAIAAVEDAVAMQSLDAIYSAIDSSYNSGSYDEDESDWSEEY